jgi:hypothetical protein
MSNKDQLKQQIQNHFNQELGDYFEGESQTQSYLWQKLGTLKYKNNNRNHPRKTQSKVKVTTQSDPDTLFEGESSSPFTQNSKTPTSQASKLYINSHSKTKSFPILSLLVFAFSGLFFAFASFQVIENAQQQQEYYTTQCEQAKEKLSSSKQNSVQCQPQELWKIVVNPAAAKKDYQQVMGILEKNQNQTSTSTKTSSSSSESISENSSQSSSSTEGNAIEDSNFTNQKEISEE